MTDLRKAAEMALEALENTTDFVPVKSGLERETNHAIQALRQALAQTEQESVICRNIYEVWAGSEGILKPLTSKEAYLLGLVEQMRDEAKKGLKPLYTAPPKREWVGLTEYQRLKFANRFHISEVAIEAIEAKLKEKNS